MGYQRIRKSVLISFSFFFLLGMGRMKIDRSEIDPYSVMIGKEYKSKVDLVVYKNDDTREFILGNFGHPLPERKDFEDKFPFRYYDSRIFGILPTGSIIKVKRVTEEGSRSASFIYYYADIISSENEEFVNKEVIPHLLADYADPPQFENIYLEEIKN